MKRLVIIAIAILLTPCLMAQPGGRPHQHQPQPPHQSHQTPTPPPAPGQQHPHQQLHTLVLNANNGEEFVVYVDGDIVNRKAMSSVLVHNLNNQPHDIYVVLKRPVDKITVMRYFPDMIVENCMVYKLFFSLRFIHCATKLVTLRPAKHRTSKKLILGSWTG